MSVNHSHPVAQDIPHVETISMCSLSKMDEFFAGIGSNMTSTQVCDVCCYNIYAVRHNINPQTKENAMFTMWYFKMTIAIFPILFCVVIYVCISVIFE